MAFRIRKNDGIAEDDWEAKEKAYRDFLSQFNKRNNSDLWKYFYWDFFHDGEIQKIVFWENPGDVTFYIECPNIKKKKRDTFEYLYPITFKCTFQGVVHFQLDHENSEELIYEQHSPFQYLFSEINTLTEIMNKSKISYKEDEVDIDFSSLIILMLGVHNSSFIEMVFSQVCVVAFEQTAFELMLSSSEFEVPIYEIKD